MVRLDVWVVLTVGLACALSGCKSPARLADASAAGTETLVILRHGEKAPGGLGQLDCKGLNRALALPRVLIGRFGRADAIFAPNPSVQMHESALAPQRYSYVRPLATIEPTAIRLGLPVNAQRGFADMAGLERAVTAPAYADSTVFIAWEHKYAREFAQQLLRSYGGDAGQVPEWPKDDFDSLYVIRIAQASGRSAPKVTFAVEREGLTGSLSESCPD